MPDRVRIVEVAPRDGLQNEPEVVSLADRLAFVRALAAAGLQEIEIGAFVREDLVPQMADSEAMARELCSDESLASVTLTALVPNEHGLERAIEAGVRDIAVFTAASDAFAERNIHMSVEKSLEHFAGVIEGAKSAGLGVRGYVSTAWWCPFEGPVEPDATRHVTAVLCELGCREVSIADTIGAATPGVVRSLLESIAADVGVDMLAAHFHDTRGTALANVLAALEVGVSVIDASAGGLGGCPFAPGAMGNLPTEDLIYMLDGLGIHSGVNLDKLRAASLRMQDIIGRRLPSHVLRAGPPPRGHHAQ
ncbi:MAG: hydroxymethylglutaryl-CoA lyase [Myxococcales bacterium]|nr:hydroxymethylglutaryl-CoA lyase [Myxococcales bacterium]